MDINMNSDQYKDKDMLKDEIIGDICSQCVLCTKRKLFGNISYIFEQFSGVCKWNYAMFISIILLQIGMYHNITLPFFSEIITFVGK